MCVNLFFMCMWRKGSENAAIYGETVGGLEDNELFAIIDTNASLPVLLVTSQVYNEVWEIRQHLIVMYII